MKLSALSRLPAIAGACLLLLSGGATEASDPSSIATTAGTLYGINGSSNLISDGVIRVQYGKEQPDGQGSIYQVLDLGQPRSVHALTFVNRHDRGTNYALKRIAVRTAPNEAAADFNPFSLASYSTVAFEESDVKPVTNEQSKERPVPIAGATARYLLIEFTYTLRQAIGRDPEALPGQPANLDTEVQFADIVADAE